jgi:uncharacterized membrane protein (UPF0127 family)
MTSQDLIIINGKAFSTLLALTSEEQEKGLMYMDFPPPIMTFVYPKPFYNSFWMKNCQSPLDIVFVRNGKVLAIHNGIPYSTSIIDCREPSDLVIEFPAGTCKIEHINVGDNIETRFSDASQKRIFFLKNGFVY